MEKLKEVYFISEWALSVKMVGIIRKTLSRMYTKCRCMYMYIMYRLFPDYLHWTQRNCITVNHLVETFVDQKGSENSESNDIIILPPADLLIKTTISLLFLVTFLKDTQKPFPWKWVEYRKFVYGLFCREFYRHHFVLYTRTS